MANLSSETPALVLGLGAVVGEIVGGVNGPFLFQRFGLNVPEAALGGVVVGAAAGLCIAVVALALRHREPAYVKRQAVPTDAHPHRA